MIAGISYWKLFKIGAPVVLLAVGAWWLYNTGFEDGEDKVELAWAKDTEERRKAQEEEVNRLKKELADAAKIHKERSDEIATQLSQLEIDHANNLAALERDHAQRMRNHTDRTIVYEYLSDSGATERANLASYAAQLDRSLEQGRLLVAELRSTVVQRDGQIQLLSEQIVADRRVINGNPDEPVN